MRNIHQPYVCGVVPLHILRRVAQHTEDEASGTARATLEHMRELATSRAATLIERPKAATPAPARPRKRCHVFDARHAYRLPGKLAMNGRTPRSADVEVSEAYDGSSATYDFFANVFRRASIDGRGMRLDSTVHYGTSFENALWNGSQMVYGHAGGRIFKRFTASVDVIGHELTHGVTQYAAALGYHGQTGALNEHLSDAFGIMVKQYTLGQNANESDWLIGADILGPAVKGVAVRSLAAPGTAYDDPVLGRDPQPAHMRDYVHTTDDNGGVHINSGILNHGLYLAATRLGGKTWEVPGTIWYATLTGRLRPEADFTDFVQATVDIAGELYGNGGRIQRILAEAWSDVGLPPPVAGCAAYAASRHKRRVRAASTSHNHTTTLERRKAS